MWSSRHLPFAVLLGLGLGLRVGDLGSVSSAVGHALGLGLAVLAYVVVLRWGTWAWLATAATAPALLDARLVRFEAGAGGHVAVYAGLSVAIAVVGWRTWARPVYAEARVVVAGSATAVLLWVLTSIPGSRSTLRLADALAHRAPLPLLLATAGVGLLAAVGVGRAATSPSRLLCAVAVLVPTAAVLVAAQSGTGTEAPLAVLWWPVAGAVGLTALMRGRRGPSVARPQRDEVDAAALRRFRERYGDPVLGPVVVVIAAYNEAGGAPGVVGQIPAEICGLHVDVVVVDDGSTDGTGSLLGDRPYVVSCPVNRGQGAALRLGYRVAREHGARYIVTTDADGQYDIADLPLVLAPVVAGRADFVSGSRILGHQQTYDRVRRTGVHVFAAIASVLCGRRITDTSFGLRAMRADLTGIVTLNQPQYQSSELLLGVIAHGYRVLEVPSTMRVRSAGATKKGTNLVYGSRYARVMLGTWWREGCPRPAVDAAPATSQVRPHAAV